jgi:hypothetical protein
MGIMDFLFGSKGKINWKELQKMIELQAETNRTNREGLFTSWTWDNAKQTQTQTVNPAFAGAVERLGYNAGRPADPYTSPSQFSQLLDAKMQNQMQRHGQEPGGYPPSASRPGRFPTAYLPPAPEPPGEGLPPPGGGLPPGAGLPPGPGRPGPGRPPVDARPPVGGRPRLPWGPVMKPHIAPDGGYR